MEDADLITNNRTRLLCAEILERSFAHNLEWADMAARAHHALIGAGTPREAVAGGYGCICVLIAPAGSQMVLIVSEDGETAFVALCFAVE